MTNWTLDTTVLDQIVGDDAKRDRWLRGVANEMIGNMQKSMTDSPATGKAYRRGGKTHIASSPGHPPRVDLGTLRASIKVRKIREKAYAIETNVLHGLETEIGVGMAPRPWMRPEFVRAGVWILDAAKGGKLA
jgi:hypothetical protein